LKNYNSFIETNLNEGLSMNIKNIFNKLKERVSKKTIKIVLISLLTIYSVAEIKELISSPEIKNDIEDDNMKEFLDELEKQKENPNDDIILSDKINNLETNFEDTLKNSAYKDISELHLSQSGWDMIRDEEKLSLTAYSIGDGMITIGYGHAERVSSSKYKIGDTITKEEANRLFHKDVNKKASGLKRLWKRWKNKGIDIKLTQNQYDALISIIYNSGVSGMLKSDFIQELKKGNYQKTAELIKTFRINDKKFPGLRIRRLKEYEKFIS